MHERSIASHRAADHIRESLEQFVDAAREWAIDGPAIAAAAALDVQGWPFAYQGRNYMAAFSSSDRPHVILPEKWVEDIATVQIDAIARPMLDTLWQAFDLAACGYYDAQGNWTPPK